MKEELIFRHGEICVPVRVFRRLMKNIRFAVLPDGSLRISCPVYVSDDELRAVLARKHALILSMLTAMQERTAEWPDFSDGSVVPCFGEDLQLRWSAVPCAPVRNAGVLIVFAREPSEAAFAVMRMFRELCREYCTEMNAQVCRLFRDAGYAVPLAKITIRSMRSQWGSCNPVSGHISINLRLAFLPKKCLYAVLCHEYAHFAHRNHSAAFYELLGQLCPDYTACDVLLRSAPGLECFERT